VAPFLCCALTKVNEAANTLASANDPTFGFTRNFMRSSNRPVQRACDDEHFA
jgi:hypothetical protein